MNGKKNRNPARVVLLALMAVACDVPPPAALDNDSVPDIAGVYSETRPVQAASRATRATSDSITYTLSIRNREGFVWGRWIVKGDDTLPYDPWESPVTGDYDPSASPDPLLLTFHVPSWGECILGGRFTDGGSGVQAYRWCERTGGVGYEHHMVKDPTGTPPVTPPGTMGAIEGTCHHRR